MNTFYTMYQNIWWRLSAPFTGSRLASLHYANELFMTEKGCGTKNGSAHRVGASYSGLYEEVRSRFGPIPQLIYEPSEI